MGKFITADEALTISKDNSIELIKDELSNIYDIIIEVANKGKTEAWYYNTISYDANEYLKNAGFELTELYDDNACKLHYKINWYKI